MWIKNLQGFVANVCSLVDQNHSSASVSNYFPLQIVEYNAHPFRYGNDTSMLVILITTKGLVSWNREKQFDAIEKIVPENSASHRCCYGAACYYIWRVGICETLWF
jgi:hypothetical protein